MATTTELLTELDDEAPAATPPPPPPPHAPVPVPAAAPEPRSVSAILTERPDVLGAFYKAFYEGGGEKHPEAWTDRIGGATPEDYAKFWYDHHGQWEGYNQHPATAAADPEPAEDPVPEADSVDQPVELTGGAPDGTEMLV